MALGDPFERREFSSNAVATTLDGAMGGTGAVTPSIADATGWPDGSDGPFYALFNGAEICLVTSRSSMTLTIASGGRGQLGTSAANHASGTSVVFVATSRDLDEANRIVNILGNGTSGLPLLGGGTATVPGYAKVGGGGIADDAIDSQHYADGSIDTAHIANNQVTIAKIAAASRYCLAEFSTAGNLSTTTGVGRYRFPFAATLVGVSAAVGTAPTGQSILIDVNKNGTTIFTDQNDRPEIEAAATASSAEETPAVTSIAIGDYLTVDIDQVGSGTVGANLTVFVKYVLA